MLENIDAIKKAKAEILEGSTMIWNARLELLVNSGNLTGALDHLNRAAESGDNCGCNSGCGALSQIDIQTLVSRLKAK